MSAPVTMEHREMACVVLHGYVPEDGSWLRGWCLDGTDGHAASWQWRQLNAVAQAIADAEARGRAAERADVVAWLRSGTGTERHASAIEDECHVGSATNPADCIQVAAQLGRR
jgi:hypothetical protein